MSLQTRIAAPVLALAAAAAIFAGPAQAAPLHPTKIEETCGYGGGSDLPEFSLYPCDIIVTDTSKSGATPPTGEVVYPGGGHVCDLRPWTESPGAGCQVMYISRQAPSGTVEYAGDSEHAPSTFTLPNGAGPREPPAPSAPVSPSGPTYTPVPVARAARTRIDHRPSRRTRSRLARFVFSGGGAREYRLDGGAWKRCGGKLSLRVATGPHTLRVRTAGVTGQMPSKPTVFSWRVVR